jgi:hypothetical protein
MGITPGALPQKSLLRKQEAFLLLRVIFFSAYFGVATARLEAGREETRVWVAQRFKRCDKRAQINEGFSP